MRYHMYNIWVWNSLNGALSEFQLTEKAAQDFAVDYPDAIYFFARIVTNDPVLEAADI